jgi:hypothetical protein
VAAAIERSARLIDDRPETGAADSFLAVERGHQRHVHSPAPGIQRHPAQIEVVAEGGQAQRRQCNAAAHVALAHHIDPPCPFLQRQLLQAQPDQLAGAQTRGVAEIQELS